MKRSRFSEEQIIAILKEHEAGVPVSGSDAAQYEKLRGSARVFPSPSGQN